MSERVCKGCGTALPPKTWQGRDRVWCSERCRKRQYDLTCVECGGRVDGTTPGKIPNLDEPVCASCAAGHYAIWTPEAIVCAIQEWADIHGEPPRATDWHSQDETHPWFSTVLWRFGTWNAAIEAAGLTPRNVGHYGRPGEDPAVVAETVRLYRSGLSMYEIARQHGVSHSCVRYRLEKAGEPIQSKRTRALPLEVRQRVIDAYLAGATIEQAANAGGVHPNTAWAWLKAAGVKRRHSNDYRQKAAA